MKATPDLAKLPLTARTAAATSHNKLCSGLKTAVMFYTIAQCSCCTLQLAGLQSLRHKRRDKVCVPAYLGKVSKKRRWSWTYEVALRWWE